MRAKATIRLYTNCFVLLLLHSFHLLSAIGQNCYDAHTHTISNDEYREFHGKSHFKFLFNSAIDFHSKKKRERAREIAMNM